MSFVGFLDVRGRDLVSLPAFARLQSGINLAAEVAPR